MGSAMALFQWAGLACCLLLAGLGGLPPAKAQLQHPHGELTRSEGLSFQVLLEQALARSPDFISLAARDEEARRYLQAGQAWLSGQPSLQLNYIDDGLRSDQGLYELEYGVLLPLWRPGERGEARQLGEQANLAAEAWRQVLLLKVAGELRASLSALDMADRLLALEEEMAEGAASVLAVSEALRDAGELAELDVMQAEAALLDQQRLVMEAEARLRDAEVNYSLLTGLPARPASVHEESLPAVLEQVPASHPELRLLEAGVAVAEGLLARSRLNARGSPSLMIGTRSQRDSRLQDRIDSVSLSFNMPIGGRQYVDAQVASVMRQKTEAEVAHRQRWRELQLAFHEVLHELELAGNSLSLLDRQVQLDERRWQMSQQAFALGELSTLEVLQALQQSRRSARQLAELELQRVRLHGEYRQVIGELP